MNDKDHREWLARNRHLLDSGHILALNEKLTPEEQAKLDAWYERLSKEE